MTHASLFTGIGGFDLAASWIGWQNLFTCEIDWFCNQILKYYFTNQTHYENIKTTDFKKWRGRVDVLTGGFPCQPFSIAGKRKGKDDDRYLWPEMLRAIREIRPTWIVAENVAGIISMVQPGCEIEVESQASLFEENYAEALLEQEYVIETVCRDFECEGYSVQPVVIPACAVGAPHRRDRVWFIANRNGHDSGRCEYGETGRTTGESEEQKEKRERFRGKFKRNGSKKAASNSNSKRQSNGYAIECKRKVSDFKERIQGDREINGLRSIRAIEHPDSQRCNKLNAPPFTNEASWISSVGHIEDWRNWPTQSPVCGNDDGFSGGLDGITFSRWRNASIKAYGNAIVPQVAYEIFKAIDKVHEL
ncbi:MAG: DNA (cytosine-5-)-methyltransferase [Tannerella sp.]|jgi:DNA (cytosine-5)-methyltransferase 1|nr:DNA (cytosine-5-)-methyltransferase [Tannerella sp.]